MNATPDDESAEDDVAESGAPFQMTLSLSVLDHLGLNLYSNIPAVLSEIVANAWDACALTVGIDIDFDRQQVSIVDDGDGMTKSDLNERFLHVGYRRRTEGNPVNRLGRHVMGRKGIGKLSLFAIADTVRVESAKDGERNGFYLRTSEIRAAMVSGNTYYPQPIQPSDLTIEVGTSLLLTDLKMKATRGSERFLRRRISRRFNVISPDLNFDVNVNGIPVAASDRGYYPSIEYLWEVGETSDVAPLCTKAVRTTRLDGVVSAPEGWRIKGWIGTVDEQKALGDEGNMLPIFAWGKVAHEDILPEIGNAGVFAKYIVGEIRADFVDLDDSDDIATSSRQSLKDTDPRFEALVEHLRVLLRQVGNKWTDWRNDDASDKARKNPVIDSWFESLGPDARKYAKQLFGKMSRLPIQDEESRVELYKHGILAFERLRFRDLLSEIDNVSADDGFGALTRAFSSIDDIESVQYGEIARGRLRIIEQFTSLADADAKERVIQQHLFDHLWLLHPSWERASTNARIEERVTTEFAGLDAKLRPDELSGRVDIRYKTAAGKHIIIELKRYGRSVGTAELLDQMRKYRNALRRVLKAGFPDDSASIECIAILGSMPDDMEPEEVADALQSINARAITYDTLIRDALESYEEYLESHVQVSRVAEVIRQLDESIESQD